MSSIPPYAQVSGRVEVKLDGQSARFSKWTNVEITRDLQDISGGFHLQFVDDGAALLSLPNMIDGGPFFEVVKDGMDCTISIDGEIVLTGSIVDLTRKWTGTTFETTISGRDKTGDMVECAALPYGPAEFTGVDLLHVATRVCVDFGITVRADVDIGEPFARLTMAPHETALAFLEKAARQRSVLLVSDGVGGLLLTRGGSSAGPAPLTVPGNIQAAEYRSSWKGRFSDYFVKGQTDSRSRRAGLTAPLDSSIDPASTPGSLPTSGATTNEASTILMTGHAIDPEITRWRPTVRLTRSQSGMSTTQEQAEWALRVARGFGDELHYTVLDWRAGQSADLWRPNQVVAVLDPSAGIDKPMLIAGVTYSEGPAGLTTKLRMVGVTAYDRINEAQKRRQRTTPNKANLDSSLAPDTVK